MILLPMMMTGSECWPHNKAALPGGSPGGLCPALEEESEKYQRGRPDY